MNLVFKALLAVATISAFLFGAVAQAEETAVEETAIVDIAVAKKLNLNTAYEKPEHGLAVTKLSEAEKQKLSKYMHDNGRCGGYELVDVNINSEMGPFQLQEQNAMEALFKHMPKPNQTLNTLNVKALKYDQRIADKVKMVSEANLKETVQWMSAYETRHHQSATKNDHVNELKAKLEVLAAKSTVKTEIDLVNHSRTQQNSVRARIIGSERPDEIVVLGAHYDSTNQSFFVKEAPGADDDASGSSNLLEIFRIMLTGEQPKRTVEFMWYAAEEVGLVGSAEIAKSYRNANKNVVGVMQLDMTLHPGSGELTLVFMTDFTSDDLTQYTVELNSLYVKANVQFDKCGYGCSDHASWHRQGYKAIMPFEATFNTMNKDIHTVRDVIKPSSSFKHSAAFTQLGVAFAMSLAN